MVKHERFFLAEYIGACPALYCSRHCIKSCKFDAGNRKLPGKSSKPVGAGWFFKGEEKEVKNGGNLPVVVLDAGHGGVYNRLK